MVVGAVGRRQAVGALRVLSAIVADYVVLHGLVVEDLEGRMQVLEVVGWQVRHQVLVVDHAVDARHDQLQVGGKISVAHPRTAVQVERRDPRRVLLAEEESWINGRVLPTTASAPPRLCPVITILAVGYLSAISLTLSWVLAETEQQALKNPSWILQLVQRKEPWQSMSLKSMSSIQLRLLSVPRQETTMALLLTSYPTNPLILVAVFSTTETWVRRGAFLQSAQLQLSICAVEQCEITEYLACRMASRSSQAQRAEAVSKRQINLPSIMINSMIINPLTDGSRPDQSWLFRIARYQYVVPRLIRDIIHHLPTASLSSFL